MPTGWTDSTASTAWPKRSSPGTRGPRRPPIPGLRRIATQELKLRGITHLLVYNYDFGRDDYMSRPDQWGLSVVGLLGGDRLYRIDMATNEH